MTDALTEYDYDLFLSHNHNDEEWTAQLAERLELEYWPSEGRNLRVYFSPWDIRPGQSIPKEIEEAIPKSRKFGLVMSPEAMASRWVELERLVRTYIEVSEREERLIPLYLRTCDIPALLRPLLPVDFRDESEFEESYQRLLAVIKDEPLPRRARARPKNPASLPATIPRRPAVGFVARRDEAGRDILEQLKAELAPERRQLVVLWGAGGVGKTTLAVEAAQGLGGVYGKRIVWTSPELRADFNFTTLLDEIATQLGRADLRPLAEGPKEEQVRALLHEANTLVILDNFETIKPEEQTRCARWLAQFAPCPALITTRYRVEAGHNVGIDAMTPDEAREFVRLWIERESHNKAAFDGLEHDRIVETAARNPLVLQWVLARVELSNEAEDVLEELTRGEGDAARRVFDSSFNLPQLTDDGRDTLLALSLFTPDASREALKEVSGFAPEDKPRLNEALTRLASLRLVETTPGNRRLKLDGLTRELARSRLKKDPRAVAFRQRFVAHFLGYAKARDQPTPEAYDALAAEKDNLLNATDVAFDMQDWQSVRSIADILAAPYKGLLYVRGYWDEALQRNEQAMKAAQAANNERNVAVFSGNTATIYQLRGEYEEARQMHEQSLAFFRRIQDEANIAVALHQLAMVAQDEGDLAEARRLYGESLEIEKRLGNQSGIASTLHELGRLAQDQGDLAEVRRLYGESLEIKKRLGNQSGIASTLHQLATVAQDEGDLAEARRLYGESLEIAKRLGDQRSIAITLHALANLTREEGDLTEARGLYNESLEITRKIGDKANLALIFNNIGVLEAAEGNREEAARLFREALSIWKRLKSPDAEMARENLARVEGESS